MCVCKLRVMILERWDCDVSTCAWSAFSNFLPCTCIAAVIIKGYFEIWKWKKHFSYLSKEKDPSNSIPVFMNDGIK